MKSSKNTSLKRKRRLYGNHQSELCYGGFLDSSSSHCVSCDSSQGGEEEEGEQKQKDYGQKVEVQRDNMMLEACDGRTAHK